jgi:hypothetical protein
MTPKEQATFEATILDACSKHRQAHWKDGDYRACVSIGTDYFVKFGDPQTLWSEIKTQLHILEYAEAYQDTPCKPRKPRIPRIIHYFRDQAKLYLVMEYVKFTASPSDFSKEIAEALRWLAGVPAPLGHVIGPLGGGRIRHGFFQDNKAPLVFSSVEALERYMNKVRPCLYFLKYTPFVNM